MPNLLTTSTCIPVNIFVLALRPCSTISLTTKHIYQVGTQVYSGRSRERCLPTQYLSNNQTQSSWNLLFSVPGGFISSNHLEIFKVVLPFGGQEDLNVQRLTLVTFTFASSVSKSINLSLLVSISRCCISKSALFIEFGDLNCCRCAVWRYSVLKFIFSGLLWL